MSNVLVKILGIECDIAQLFEGGSWVAERRAGTTREALAKLRNHCDVMVDFYTDAISEIDAKLAEMGEGEG